MKKSVLTRYLSIVVLLFLQCVFPTLVFGAPPVITSFSPASGPVGSHVILSGSGFHTDASQNIVYFGKVRTKVLEATDSRLVIEVPHGAAADIITVTVNGLTADSDKPFLITYPVSTEMPSGTFVHEWWSPSGQPGSLADLDNDGKLDIITLQWLHSVRVIRNSTSGGKLTFDAPIDLHPVEIHPGPQSSLSATADLDGDGKTDIVVLSAGTNTFGVFKNTTVGNSISFAPQVFYTISQATLPSSGLCIKDLEGDGRPDIVVSDSALQKVRAFRNTSSMGNISFVPVKEFVTNGNPRHVTSADLDGDHKPDIVVAVKRADGKYDVEILKNSATGGDITFNDKIVFQNFPVVEEVELADLNNDGKTDVLIPTSPGRGVILKNVSSAGNLEFEYNSSPFTMNPHLTIGDLNGDGKLDVMSHFEDRIFSETELFRNTGTGGNFSFEKAQATYDMLYSKNESLLGDMNGDGKLDVVNNLEFVGIYVNRMADWKELGYCEGSDVSITTDEPGGYQWQVNQGTGFFNLTDNGTSIIGSKTATLQLKNIPSSWDGYQYRCFTNGASYGIVHVLKKKSNSSVPVVTINSPATTICSGTNISFTATATNAGANATYQWQVNGVNVTQQTATSFSSSTLSNNDVVKVLLINKNVCGFNDSVSSNTISVVVNSVVNPAVSVSASRAAICEGETVTFTAVPQNGGNQPSYQWSKNGTGVGSNSNQYTDATLKTGDLISVLLTSNAACLVTPSASSNKLSAVVNKQVTPTVSLEGQTTLIMGQSTTLIANIMHSGDAPSFQWQDSTRVHTWQNIINATTPTLNYSPFSTGDRVRLQLTSNAGCVTVSSVTSQPLVFIVNSPGIVNPNPVEGTLQVRGLNPADNWQTLEIHNVSTGKKIIIQSIVGQTQVSVDVARLSPGLHVMILKNSEGKMHQMKFVKL